LNWSHSIQMSLPMSPEVSLVALFYNEEASVENVIRDGYRVLTQIGVPFEIVAIQNGSLDRTPEILARLKTEIEELRIVIIEQNQGAGYGALRGLYSAVGKDVIGVSGDGQVDLDLIPKMYEFKRQCSGDIAYGRRIRRPDGPVRAMISRSYNLLMRWVFGLQSKDVNGPPKIISRTVLEAMQLKSTDQFLECEMMLKAQRMGLTMCSIDVEFHAREGGESSIGWRDCRDYLRNLLTVLVSRNDPWGIHQIPESVQKAAWIHQGDVADPNSAGAAAFRAIKAER
jgi:glycosyltransferase involved in cell wall biosynthesis